MAVNTVDRYKIENDADERGSFRAMLLDLASDVTLLRRDVSTLIWVMVPVACTALVLALAAFIVAVIK